MNTALVSSSRLLLLVDAAGALLSAAILLLLSFHHDFVGLPAAVLRALATPAAVFFLISGAGYLSKPARPARLLSAIAVLNFMYCVVTLWVALNFASALTWAGWTYFVLEAIVILALVRLELRAVKALRGAARVK
jgi:FtsH-binding integral membrane protein